MTGWWDCAFRRAPRGGADRRSAFPCLRAVMLGGVRAERGVMTGGWDCAFRSPPGSGADRRSAFPCLRAVMLGGVRAERGVMRGSGTVRFAALGAAVPTGGRRSVACGA